MRRFSSSRAGTIRKRTTRLEKTLNKAEPDEYDGVTARIKGEMLQ